MPIGPPVLAMFGFATFNHWDVPYITAAKLSKSSEKAKEKDVKKL